MSQDPTANDIAVIQITLDTFAPGSQSTGTATLNNNLSTNGRSQQKGDQIILKYKQNKPLDVLFTIANGGSSPNWIVYSPTSVQFTQIATVSDPDGSADFSNPTLSTSAITVTDLFAAVSSPQWKYRVNFTTPNTNGPGVLTSYFDPSIENTDQD